jgi:hypothetical protein
VLALDWLDRLFKKKNKLERDRVQSRAEEQFPHLRIQNIRNFSSNRLFAPLKSFLKFKGDLVKICIGEQF